jgi:hypothetical protein
VFFGFFVGVPPHPQKTTRTVPLVLLKIAEKKTIATKKKQGKTRPLLMKILL